ncbi:zinc finger protein 271-like [Penaeus chinensis]|uniref:zinc finger protein 271-like n=1 Tax=Penaeus chinensis TaxID=139456 RepID=UPI001FB614E4|nr:zinc finger protein 271-like [Penaeus chinensis]
MVQVYPWVIHIVRLCFALSATCTHLHTLMQCHGNMFSASGSLLVGQCLLMYYQLLKSPVPFSFCYLQRYLMSSLVTKIHMRVHTKEKPYSCDICNNTFSQKNPYEKSLLSATRFLWSSHLVQHMVIHTKENPYLHVVSNDGLSQKENFVLHVRLHREAMKLRGFPNEYNGRNDT